jgi:hypothetical protein
MMANTEPIAVFWTASARSRSRLAPATPATTPIIGLAYKRYLACGSQRQPDAQEDKMQILGERGMTKRFLHRLRRRLSLVHRDRACFR